VSVSVFLVGVGSFLESADLLNALIYAEIVLLGGNFHLLISALLWASLLGQVFVLNFLSTTASETVIGLTFLIIVYRAKGVNWFQTDLGLRG